MEQEFSEIDEYVVVSDVLDRDRIGVEVYKNGEAILEVFRDDTERTRELTLFKDKISLELIEQSLELFKRKITWDFIDD